MTKMRIRIFVRRPNTASHRVYDKVNEYENPHKRILENAAKHNAAITYYGEDSYELNYTDAGLEVTVIANIFTEES